MGKALGGFFRLLLTLLILLSVGYNSWQVSLLRADVAALQRENARAHDPALLSNKTPAAHGGAAANSDASLLARAQHHAEQARAFLRKNQYADAQRELAEATHALEEAGQDARSGSQSAVRRLRQTLQALSHQADTLWGGKERGK